jgi:hypothetical protein
MLQTRKYVWHDAFTGRRRQAGDMLPIDTMPIRRLAVQCPTELVGKIVFVVGFKSREMRFDAMRLDFQPTNVTADRF